MKKIKRSAAIGATALLAGMLLTSCKDKYDDIPCVYGPPVENETEEASTSENTEESEKHSTEFSEEILDIPEVYGPPVEDKE